MMSRDCGEPVRRGLDSWMEWIKSGLVEYRPISDKRLTGWWWYEVKRRVSSNCHSGPGRRLTLRNYWNGRTLVHV